MWNVYIAVLVGVAIVTGDRVLAAEPIDVCQSMVISSARNIGVKTGSNEYLQTVYDKYCEQNGSVKSSTASGGLSIPGLPVSLTGGVNNSEAKIKNFCSNHQSNSSGSSSSVDYKSVVVEKALDAALQCVGIVTKSNNSVVYDIVNSDLISIKMQISPGQTLEVQGISHDGSVICEGADVSNPGKTIIYGTGTGQKVTASTGFHGISCTRKPYADRNGSKFYFASGIIIATNSGTIDIFWPQETVVPLITASDIQNSINRLENKINDVSDKLDINVLPIGSIIPWFETNKSPPAGWAKCDGSELAACPDLRGLFLLGAGSDAVAKQGGGEKLNFEIASSRKDARGDGWNEGGKNYIGFASLEVPKPPHMTVLYIKKVAVSK